VSAPFVNRREVRLLAMRRSGHHAVVHWILSQLPGPGLFSNDGKVDGGRLVGNRFSRYVNLDDDAVARDRAGELVAKDLYLWNAEDRAVEEMAALAAPAARGASREVVHLLVLRDPWNWLASRRRAEPERPLAGTPELAAWKGQVREALRRTRLLAPLVAVDFRRWVAEETYRRDLAAVLDLPFTDAGFREVALPGLSSFATDAVRADNAVVLSRHRELAGDPEIEAALDGETLELAAAFFGWRPDGSREPG
jgi:hypothetical protein